MSVLWNRMSHCTTSLNAEANLSVAVIDFGPGRAHMRHERHVSTISLHKFSANGGAPARWSSSRILAAGACQKRMCSRRRVRRTIATSRLFKSWMARPMSKAIHSLSSLSPACVAMATPRPRLGVPSATLAGGGGGAAAAPASGAGTPSAASPGGAMASAAAASGESAAGPPDTDGSPMAPGTRGSRGCRPEAGAAPPSEGPMRGTRQFSFQV